ncbi:MAG: hypothetical protein AABW56_02395 [Nanoarchaeota archaeon]
MQKRGQAATEFLSTYGLAMLILAIVIGLLFAYNLFNPKILNTCSASEPISCEDIRVDGISNNLELVLTASGVSILPGEETQIVEVEINKPDFVICDLSSATGTVLQNEIQTLFTCDFWLQPFTLVPDDKFSGTATINYKLPGSTGTYTARIIFSGTVE